MLKVLFRWDKKSEYGETVKQEILDNILYRDEVNLGDFENKSFFIAEGLYKSFKAGDYKLITPLEAYEAVQSNKLVNIYLEGGNVLINIFNSSDLF